MAEERVVISQTTPFVRLSNMKEGDSFRGFYISKSKMVDKFKEMEKEIYEIEITKEVELSLSENGEKVERKVEVGEYVRFDSRCKPKFERAMKRGIKVGQELEVVYKGEDKDADTTIKPKVYELAGFNNFKPDMETNEDSTSTEVDAENIPF
jgi:hypothetical protein